MNDHVTMIHTDQIHYWYACLCGKTGTKFPRLLGIECAEQDAAYHQDRVGEETGQSRP